MTTSNTAQGKSLTEIKPTLKERIQIVIGFYKAHGTDYKAFKLGWLQRARYKPKVV